MNTEYMQTEEDNLEIKCILLAEDVRDKFFLGEKPNADKTKTSGDKTKEEHEPDFDCLKQFCHDKTGKETNHAETHGKIICIRLRVEVGIFVFFVVQDLK